MWAIFILSGLLIAGILADVFHLDDFLGSMFGDKAGGLFGGNEDDGDNTPDSDDEPTSVIEGRMVADVLDGTEGDDEIDARGGRDTVAGLGGNDLIEGGGGHDELDGGGGDDTIFGDDGNDSVLGRTGNDILYGGDGFDTLKGGAGNDTLVSYFDGSNDALFRTTDFLDPDSVAGGAGDDVFYAGSGDTLDGGEGADSIFLGDWIDPDHPVNVNDYDADEDKMFIILPTSYSGLGQVTVSHSPGGTHSGTVFVDGVRMAEIAAGGSMGELSPANIEVIYRANFAP